MRPQPRRDARGSADGHCDDFPARSWSNGFRHWFGNPLDLSYKPCSERTMRRADGHRPAIVAAVGNIRVATQDNDQNGHYGDSPKRSLQCGFPQTLQNPREFQRNGAGQEKMRGSGPFRGEKARQNAGSRWLKCAGTGANSCQNGHIWRSLGVVAQRSRNRDSSCRDRLLFDGFRIREQETEREVLAVVVSW